MCVGGGGGGEPGPPVVISDIVTVSCINRANKVLQLRIYQTSAV